MENFQSPYQELNQPTYSQILNNPQKSFTPIHLFNQSPFQMIVDQYNQKDGTSERKIGSYRQFVKEDLHRNSLAQSVDGGPQLQNSQVISRCQVNPQYRTTYLEEYEAEESPYKQPYDQLDNSEKHKQNKMFRNVFSYPNQSIQSQQNNQVKKISQFGISLNKITAQSSQQQHISPPYTQLQVHPPQQINLSLTHSAKQEISQVKYRLDELMKKFPMTQQKYNKNQKHKREPTTMTQNSAPQLYVKRSVSFQGGHHLNGVLLNFNSEENNNRLIPHTQMKIAIPLALQESNSYLPSYSSKMHYPESLNYSQSNNASLNFHVQNSMESLYKQIRQQEQVIALHKKIIFGLENDNRQLSLLLTQHQQNEKILVNTQAQTQYQELQNKQKANFQNSQKLIQDHNQSLKQQVQILQFEKAQLLKKITWLNSVIEQMISISNNSSTKIIQRNSQKQSRNQPILIQQNKVTNKQVNFQPLTQQNHAFQSIPVQTSFIDPITQNFNQFNYKRLYEKQIQSQQRMKVQMHQLQMIQLAYDEQFKNVLQQIKQIKQSRSYYQLLKQQISNSNNIQKPNKTQERSNSKKNHQKSNNSHKNCHNSYSKEFKNFHLQKTQNPQQILNSNLNNKFGQQPNSKKQHNNEKIFQNLIIYQLKTENQILKEKLHYLTKQFLSKNQNQVYIPTKQSPFRSNIKLYDKNYQQNHLIHSTLVNQKQNQNVFTIENQFNNQNPKQRPDSNNISIVQKLRKRPQSFVDLSYKQTSRLISQNKLKDDKNRKNGTISYLSYSNLSSVKTNPQLVKKFSKIKEKIMKQSVQNMKNLQNYPNLFQKSSNYQIVEQKSEKWTQQSSRQVIVNRYNNFIKNMKQRFGINSQIIGKQIVKNN